MRLKRILITLTFIFVAILIFSGKVDASGLRLKELQYDVTLNSDGTADVTEKWNIYIEDTNTLFKTFEIDKSKYKEITDVSVREITNGTKKEFRQINEEMYHVTKGCFYALVNSNREFEIAWGVQIQNQTKTYEISYTIVDAVKNYNDCSEFYWQFISKKSEIPADIVKGTIKLPIAVSNIEDFRVWAHGPLNGNITKQSESGVTFEVQGLQSNTMLEARVVTPTITFYNNDNNINTNKLAEILEEEQRWADEANAERERIAKRQELKSKVLKYTSIVINVIGLAVAIWIIKKIIEYAKILKEIPKSKQEEKIEYFRDIPDESATPAEVGALYYFGTYSDSKIPKIVSATMLDLCLKKYLQFEVSTDKKKEIKVIINKEQSTKKLPKDEKKLYDTLVKIAKDDNSFTMKEFQKYCEKNSSSIQREFSEIELLGYDEQQRKGNYSWKLKNKSLNWISKGIVPFLFIAVLGFLISIFSIMSTYSSFSYMTISGLCIMCTVVIPASIAMTYALRISSRFNRLPQKGIEERNKWIGLKKYMEDFSMIDDKTVPELILWEKYLVYATVFGIADKALKQLEVIYPQISDTEYMSSHGYAYMYLMYSGGINNSFINSLNSTIKSTYDSINYSSGSGSGGGFSGGGGGRRRRRPEWAEDKMYK